MVLILFHAAAAADRPFEVHPFGWVRPTFSWRQDDDALVTDTDGFGLGARIGLEASAEPIHMAARVEMELSPEPVLKDAFVNWTPHPLFSMNAGQMKVPFSLEQLASDTRRQLPLDAPFVAAAGFSRDMGVSAEGRLAPGGKTRATLTSAARAPTGSRT
jgi:hypothetical protein